MADLILNFKTQGLSDARRDLDSFKSSALEANDEVLQAWLAAKDTRQKTLDDIQRIEAKAGSERLAQERAILSQLKAEQKAAAKEEADWAALQARASADAAKAAAREESAAAKQAASDYISFWKNALKEKEAAEKAAQASLESRNASAGGLGPLGIVSKTPSTEENGGFFNTLNAGLINASSALNIYDQIASAVGRIATAYADCIEQAAKWEQLQVGLKNMEGSAEGAAHAMNDLYVIAKAPGIEMEGAEKAYLKLRAVGESATDAKKLIKDFANTVSLSGGGSVQFDRVLEQTVQMIANGKVMQQDVRWMKDSMPQLAVMMQNAYGTSSVEAIRKMHIGATQFISDIEKQMELLPRSGETLRSDLENTETAWSRFKAALVDTEWTKGFLNELTDKLEQFEHRLSKDSTQLQRDQYRNNITQQLTVARNNSENNKTSMFVPGFLQHQVYGGTSDADIQKQVAAEMKLYDATMAKSGSGFSMDQDAKDSAAKFKKYQDDLKANAPKEKVDHTIENDRKRLAREQETNSRSLEAEKVYQRELDILKEDHVQDSIAKVEAQADKEISIAERKYKEDLALAHGQNDLEVEAARERDEKIRQIHETAHDKIRDIYEKESAEAVKSSQQLDKTLGAKADAIAAKILALQAKITEAEDRTINKAQLNDEDWSQKSFKSPTDINRTYDEQQRVAEDAKTFRLGRNQNELTATEASIDKRTATGEISGDQGGQEILNAQEEAAAKEREILEQTRQYEANILAKRKNAQIEFWKEVTHTVASAAETLTDSIADLVGNVQGKGSAAYKTLFATSKAFAIADASLQLADAAAKAWNGTFPGNIADVAMVATEGAAIISNINSLSYSGVFKDGGDIPAGSYGIAGETGQPEIIQGPAHVTSVKDTADLLGSKAPVVNIHNYAGASVSTSQGQDGSIQVIIDAVEKKLSAGIIAGGSALDTTFRRTYGMKR